MSEITDDAGSSAKIETFIDASGTPIIKLIGEIDIASVKSVRTGVDAAVADSPTRAVMDLSELRFMDSSGLTMLLSVADRVGELELRNPSAIIRKVINLTGLSSVFVMTP